MKQSRITARGYTLLELAIAMTLTTALLLIGLPWVMSLISSKNTATEHGGFSRQVDAIEATAMEDLQDLTVCGADTRFETLTSTTSSWYANKPGGMVLVEWNLNNGELRRTTYKVADQVNCDTSPNAQTQQSWTGVQVVAKDLETTTRQLLFTPELAGTPVAAGVSLEITDATGRGHWLYNTVRLP